MTVKRPQRPSADATRDKIYKAALQLFMSHGYAGTSMSKLAEKAGVNQTLIFHHFENKEKLWRYVKTTMVANVKATPIPAEPENLTLFIEAVIAQRLSLYGSCPQLRKLVAWQKLETGSNKAAILDIPNHEFSPWQWVTPIQYLQQQKKLDRKLDPALLISWLVASVNVIIEDDQGYFKKNPDSKNEYIELLIKTITRGLQ